MRRPDDDRMAGAAPAESVTLRLARPADADTIGNMSRELIENGLGWSWRRERVELQIDCPDTVALVAESRRCIVGFAIMYFGAEVAHLNLLAVARARQRMGIGRRLITWLERSARVAGVASVRLEVRANNRSARAFYRALGYCEIALAPRYYRGRESAIRMEHTLIPIRVPDGATPPRNGS
ncbi:MAG: GNAT family N-acetyltransferase [Gammaproteobacteria bacterium]|nr:GNAT family N-acetyltransferase [Gammaproteobacteria bacterium]NIR84930.1 GNAT family N-acetyltransferase [Gammaproteobacteria bacterium]NIR91779.1 GNAT family N-acetyltransferase [Gammaproteobacteria bacterium]NIU05977.1 GNAT family N-acetyltransferase [Gammaproteobacteria bacterium]NIV53024.1 GNAT family N-acetyltransferase [Gammaproteobacteria bacterium]